MIYNRRQFLILTGGFVGATFATITHQFSNDSETNNFQEIKETNNIITRGERKKGWK